MGRFGWKPDRLDWRDQKLTPHPELVRRVALPPAHDLRGQFMPPVYDQLNIGSCVCNSSAAAVDFERKAQGESFLFPSRLWLYWVVRATEDTPPDQDSGCEIRDAIKVLAASGVPPESDWPYIESKFSVQPSAKAFVDAGAHKTLKYSRVTQQEYFLKHCMAILGRPVVFGISCFSALESDEVAKTGDLPMPTPGEPPLGGHAIVLVGYDDSSKRFMFRNSWGVSWGNQGYGMIPYSYVTNPDLASDFWTILAEE